MTDRMSSLRMVDPVLTNIALGYKNAQYISEALFPVVQCPKEAVLVPKFGAHAFTVYDTQRAPRAMSNEMTPDSANLIDILLKEHDLAYPLDRREIEESLLDEQAKAVKRAKDAIELEIEYRAAQLAQADASYDVSAVKTLAVADQWTVSTGDPIKIICDAREKIRNKIGLRPNTMVIGAKVYSVLKFHEAFQAQLGSDAHKMITTDFLCQLFDMKAVVVGDAVYNKGADFGDIWGNNIILAYVADTANGGDYESPSFGYTFRRQGMPQVDVYDKEGGKIQYCRYTDIYKVDIIGKDAGFMIKNCVK